METTIGVTWISFPDLPHNIFAKKAIFSTVATIGKPLTVDLAIKNQTKPNFAKVNMEVDLMAKLPQKVKITEENDDTGETRNKWINV